MGKFTSRQIVPVFIIIAVIIIAILILLYRNSVNRSSSTGSTNSTSSTASELETSSSQDTNLYDGWKSFSSPTDNLSFMYPPNWTENETSSFAGSCEIKTITFTNGSYTLNAAIGCENIYEYCIFDDTDTSQIPEGKIPTSTFYPVYEEIREDQASAAIYRRAYQVGESNAHICYQPIGQELFIDHVPPVMFSYELPDTTSSNEVTNLDLIVKSMKSTLAVPVKIE